VTHPLLITLLAEGPKNTGPDFGKASPIGLLIVVLLLIGVFALVWSMNRHLKRVPESFDAPDEVPSDRGADKAAKTDAGVPGEPKGESGG
jgi:hypothetical protein